ncbi:transmembrane protein 200C-like [Podarcis raffonei]|uniref:transmembrane protein 200C-like n=1 Tax=Podarcis raffonei TaxID=65483 RepID=UPI0023295521|nr:transmembrane protein 200C-like [Podarcis raffonei]
MDEGRQRSAGGGGRSGGASYLRGRPRGRSGRQSRPRGGSSHSASPLRPRGTERQKANGAAAAASRTACGSARRSLRRRCFGRPGAFGPPQACCRVPRRSPVSRAASTDPPQPQAVDCGGVRSRGSSMEADSAPAASRVPPLPLPTPTPLAQSGRATNSRKGARGASSPTHRATVKPFPFPPQLGNNGSRQRPGGFLRPNHQLQPAGPPSDVPHARLQGFNCSYLPFLWEDLNKARNHIRQLSITNGFEYQLSYTLSFNKSCIFSVILPSFVRLQEV